MADWQTVRFDPSYAEPLDPELIPLLDALNNAGFVTISSCSGHGRDWASIHFAHSTDEQIESLARFVMRSERGDYREYFTVWRKEILLEPNELSHRQPYVWRVELHQNEVYATTPLANVLANVWKFSVLTAETVMKFSAASLRASSADRQMKG